MLRSSPLFQFRHGDHICVFYRSQEFLQSILTPYIMEGLRKGERCFLAQKPDVARMLLYDLRFLGLDPDRETNRGALEIHTEDEVYFQSNRFDPERLMEMLMRSVDDSLQCGFTGFRTAGELSWAANNERHCDQLIGYEALVNRKYPGRAATGMCQYAIDDFSHHFLDAVLEHHQQHLADSHSTSSYSSVRLQYEGYETEIVADKYLLNPRFYYVVQKRRAPGVLAWGIAPTFEAATVHTEQIIRRQAAAV